MKIYKISTRSTLLKPKDNAIQQYYQALQTYGEHRVTHEGEISKKIGKGYPTSNIIFEDTRQAVLFQGGIERNRFDLTKPQQVADLNNNFYAMNRPQIV